MILLFVYLAIFAAYGNDEIEDQNKHLPLCDKAKCRGTYKLSIEKGKKLVINSTTTNVLLTTYPKEIEIITYKREYYKSYCYNGDLINGGCYDSVNDMSPTPNEAKRWYQEDKCPTGYQCEPQGECWGSDSDKCTGKPAIVTDKGPTKLKWLGMQYIVFSHHGCVMSWACNVHVERVPVHLKLENWTTVPFITTPSGKVIEYKKYPLNYKIKDNEGFYHALYSEYKDPVKEITKAECYVGSENDMVCLVTNGNLKNQPIFIDPDYLIGINGNYLVTIYDKVILPSGGQLTVRGRSQENPKWETKANVPKEPHKPASIGDVWNVYSHSKALEMRSYYNFFLLKQSVEDIQKQNKELVNALAKIDETLIGKIIGENIKTHWQNEDIFSVCPCHKLKVDSNSNCDHDLIYESGSYRKRNEKDVCISIDPNKTRKIILGIDAKIQVDSLNLLPLVGSDESLSTWEWIRELRLKYNDLYDTSPSGSMMADIRSAIEKEISFPFRWFDWISSVSSVVAWLALGLHLIRR